MIPSLALAALAAAGTAAGAVPFQLADTGTVMVPAFVNGQGPHRFLLDTGAAGTAVSGPLAAVLGLPPVARTVVVTPAGDETRVVARIGSLAVGHAEASGIQATVLPRGGLPRGAAGILGQDFLARFDYTIDYRRRLLVWGPAGDTGPRLPLREEDGLLLVDLAQDDGAPPMRFVPDSGAHALVVFERGRAFRLPSDPIAARGSLASASGRRLEVEMRTVRRLRVGTLTLRDQPAAVVPRHGEAGGDGLLPLHQFASVAFASRDGYLVITPR